MIAPDGLRQQLKKGDSGYSATGGNHANACGSKEHPTATKIYEEIQRQHPNLAMGTVITHRKIGRIGVVTSLGTVVMTSAL